MVLAKYWVVQLPRGRLIRIRCFSATPKFALTISFNLPQRLSYVVLLRLPTWTEFLHYLSFSRNCIGYFPGGEDGPRGHHDRSSADSMPVESPFSSRLLSLPHAD